jgi:serine/threonine-protein kinase
MDEQKQVAVKSPTPDALAHDVDDSSLIGHVLSGKYKITSEVGRGGMGTVYKAEHLLLSKFQAVKVMHRHLTEESQNLNRFQIEAKAASALRHENLLTVTDYGLTLNSLTSSWISWLGKALPTV